MDVIFEICTTKSEVDFAVARIFSMGLLDTIASSGWMGWDGSYGINWSRFVFGPWIGQESRRNQDTMPPCCKVDMIRKSKAEFHETKHSYYYY